VLYAVVVQAATVPGLLSYLFLHGDHLDVFLFVRSHILVLWWSRGICFAQGVAASQLLIAAATVVHAVTIAACQQWLS